MASSDTVSTITPSRLNKLLKSYPYTLQLLASKDEKGPKDAKPLPELDELRYRTFRGTVQVRKNAMLGPHGYLTKEELEDLMAFKIIRGTYRPTLMPLIRSNSAEICRSTTAAAFTLYAGSLEDPFPALKKLAELRGVGPATASLILSVVAPKEIPFFADELLHWLRGHCPGEDGVPPKLKYDFKEYKELLDGVTKIKAKLNCGAEDVERGVWALYKGFELGFKIVDDESSEESTPKKRGKQKDVTSKGVKQKDPKKKGAERQELQRQTENDDSSEVLTPRKRGKQREVIPKGVKQKDLKQHEAKQKELEPETKDDDSSEELTPKKRGNQKEVIPKGVKQKDPKNKEVRQNELDPETEDNDSSVEPTPKKKEAKLKELKPKHSKQKNEEKKDVKQEDFDQMDVDQMDGHQLDVDQEDVNQKKVSRKEVNQKDANRKDIKPKDAKKTKAKQKEVKQEEVKQEERPKPKVVHQKIILGEEWTSSDEAGPGVSAGPSTSTKEKGKGIARPIPGKKSHKEEPRMSTNESSSDEADTVVKSILSTSVKRKAARSPRPEPVEKKHKGRAKMFPTPSTGGKASRKPSTGGKPPGKALSGAKQAPLEDTMSTEGKSSEEAVTGVKAEPSTSTASTRRRSARSEAPIPEDNKHKGRPKMAAAKPLTGGKPPGKALSGKGLAPPEPMMSTDEDSSDEADTGVQAEPSTSTVSTKRRSARIGAPNPEEDLRKGGPAMPRMSTGGMPPRKAAPLGSSILSGGSPFDEADAGVEAGPSTSIKKEATASAAPKPEKRHKGARAKQGPRMSTGGKAPRKAMNGEGHGP